MRNLLPTTTLKESTIPKYKVGDKLLYQTLENSGMCDRCIFTITGIGSLDEELHYYYEVRSFTNPGVVTIPNHKYSVEGLENPEPDEVVRLLTPLDEILK